MHQQSGYPRLLIPRGADPLKSQADAVRSGGKFAFHYVTFAKGLWPVYDGAMKAWLVIAAINGGLAVVAGAFAQHGLRGLDAHALDVFETGARYHMYHALAMGQAAIAAQTPADPLGLLDTTAAAHGYDQQLADAEGLLDAAAQLLAAAQNPSDALGLLDTASRISIAAQLAADLLGIADLATQAFASVQTPTDLEGLVRIRQAIEVEVGQGEVRGLVELHQGEGGAGHLGLIRAEGPDQRPGQHRLARAQGS